MDADILTMSSKGQISIPAKIRKEMSVSIGNKFVIYLWYKCQKYKNSVQACLQKNLLSFDTQKIWVSSHFLQKNERITNIFARIARSEAVAILYQWVSNTFDTHIKLYYNISILQMTKEMAYLI